MFFCHRSVYSRLFSKHRDERKKAHLLAQLIDIHILISRTMQHRPSLVMPLCAYVRSEACQPVRLNVTVVQPLTQRLEKEVREAVHITPVNSSRAQVHPQTPKHTRVLYDVTLLSGHQVVKILPALKVSSRHLPF